MANRWRKNHARAGSMFHQQVQRLRHACSFALHFHAEKYLGHDVQRELHHLLVKISRLAIFPGGEELASGGSDCFGI